MNKEPMTNAEIDKALAAMAKDRGITKAEAQRQVLSTGLRRKQHLKDYAANKKSAKPKAKKAPAKAAKKAAKKAPAKAAKKATKRPAKAAKKASKRPAKSSKESAPPKAAEVQGEAA